MSIVKTSNRQEIIIIIFSFIFFSFYGNKKVAYFTKQSFPIHFPNFEYILETSIVAFTLQHLFDHVSPWLLCRFRLFIQNINQQQK